MSRRRAVTIKDGVVLTKKSKPSRQAGALVYSLRSDDDDNPVGFFASHAEPEEAPMQSEPDEYTRFVADLTTATDEKNESGMYQLVLRRFDGLLATPVLLEAIYRRRETMAFVSHALDTVLKLYIFPAYIRYLPASYTGYAPSHSHLIDLCQPIESLYMNRRHGVSFGTAVHGLMNDVLDINLTSYEQSDAQMHMLRGVHEAARDLARTKVLAAKGPWITAHSVDSYDYLTRLGTTPWNTNPSDKLAFACETARGFGAHRDTPANLSDEGKIAAEWKGNLGMELVFPYSNAARCADYNEIIFGCLAITATKHETTRQKACVISAALRLFVKLADDYFESIDVIDGTGHFGELGVATMVAEYAFPLPLEHPPNRRNYTPMRAFIADMIRHSDQVCRIGSPTPVTAWKG